MNKPRLHKELTELLHEIEVHPAKRQSLAPRLYEVIADLAVAGEQPQADALRAVRKLQMDDPEGNFENMPV